MKKFTVLAVLTVFVLSAAILSAGVKSTNHKKKEAKEDSSLSGKVVETMNSGGYTYACIEKSGKKIWVAVPQVKIKVGQHAAFQPGAEMSNFESKTLNRKFDSIVFSAGLAGGNIAAKSPHEGSKSALSSVEKVKVEKASGPNAHTVADLYLKSSSLDKKKVVVRGRVVKVSAGIMGKNWVHIQDGTGEASKGNYDVVVTTQDMPSVGDTVLINGTLCKDKDFGSGYKYKVIVEEATIKK